RLAPGAFQRRLRNGKSSRDAFLDLTFQRTRVDSGDKLNGSHGLYLSSISSSCAILSANMRQHPACPRWLLPDSGSKSCPSLNELICLIAASINLDTSIPLRQLSAAYLFAPNVDTSANAVRN